MDAKACGSVNTISLNGNLLVGDTTDGEGCVEALASKGISTLRERVLIIGAGGAAKAIAHSMAKRGPKRLYIVNRTMNRAENLVRGLNEYENIQARPWEDLMHCLGRSRIIINCTTVGMHGNVDSLPIPKEGLDESKVVMDIVYDPLQTNLLRCAEEAGSLAINGLEMLVHQGAISFEKWTGLKPPVDIMKTAITEQLMVNHNGRSHSVNRAYG
jgi:shikimate dehydrogenase